MVVPLDKLDFDILAKHYYPLLTQRAQVMCYGNHTTAEEAVQDTIMTAWDKLSQVRPGHFDSWINQILTNKVRDARRANRSKNYMMAPLPKDFDRTDKTTTNDSEVYDRIMNAIETLPDNYRDVCKLTLVDELEQKDIAAKLNLPLGTVQSRQSRSKLILQNKLKDLRNG